MSAFLRAFDEFFAGSLATFIAISNTIGGDVKEQAALVHASFNVQRNILDIASKSRRPAEGELAKIVQPLVEKINCTQSFREKKRRSAFFNHLSAVSEAIPALGWISVSPAPGPYVKEMIDAATFYTNRVLKEFKDKGQDHAKWVNAWIGTLTELQAYIKAHHTTGLVWNIQVSATGAISSAPSQCPPPPSPSTYSTDDGTNAKSALFADLSKGASVTSGLKKITDDMKTHKNLALRQQHEPTKQLGAKPQSTAAPAVGSTQLEKVPVTALRNNKWVIEHHRGNKDIVIDRTELKHTVYMYKCVDCVIHVKSKIHSIILDSCQKTAVVCSDVVASLEFVNCLSVQAQTSGKVPTVSIDKTDGCMVYLSKHSLDTEIISAKSSEMNVLVPVGDGDYKEFALPEQFKTTWNGKTMVTLRNDI